MQTICLLNDSFPPQIDGVANAVKNYAVSLHARGDTPVVITPAHPDAADEGYPFPILRYPSVSLPKMVGYKAGIPFSPEVAHRVSKAKPALLHSHCPIMSTYMARQLRQITDAPIVLTYHTKFDIDIANIVESKPLQNACKKLLAENIRACDEVWTVSRGAEENLRQLGYEGAVLVMPNGVDLSRQRADAQQIHRATAGCDLPEGVPVYLFVGRLMWYKGIRLILDALAALRKDFRMVFVGSGQDREEMESYAAHAGIGSRCIFTGAITDRELLRAWYSRADLFLFPSAFDTNGLVAREAAACSLPSVLLTGSCAAEGVTDGRNGFLIGESAESLLACLRKLYGKKDLLRQVGLAASRELYLSWQEAVNIAAERYPAVIERYNTAPPKRLIPPTELLMMQNGELMEAFSRLTKYFRSRE